MSNLRKLMPQVSPTVQAIMDQHKKVGDAQHANPFLDASIIGHCCDRYLWYKFHDCLKPNLDGRAYRMNETRRLTKYRLARELRETGVNVVEVAETGLPFKFLAHGGHFEANMDGCVLGVVEAPKTWHVLKVEEHSDDSFCDLVGHGVKIAEPEHYADMIVCMGLTKMRRALYIAVNLNTDELHAERIRFDKKEFDLYMSRAFRVIESPIPLGKLTYASADTRECQKCDAKEHCWPADQNAPAFPVAQLSCKQCRHAMPMFDSDHGQWRCVLKNTIVDHTQPCDDMLCLSAMFSDFAEVESAEIDSITFKSHDGAIWTHGNDSKAGHYNAKTLMKLPSYLLVNEDVAKVKEEFNAIVENFLVCQPKTLLDAFAWEDSRLVWKGTPAELPAKCMELLKIDIAAAVPAQTSQDETHSAARFGNDICVVYYSNGTTAIWQGVS